MKFYPLKSVFSIYARPDSRFKMFHNLRGFRTLRFLVKNHIRRLLRFWWCTFAVSAILLIRWLTACRTNFHPTWYDVDILSLWSIHNIITHQNGVFFFSNYIVYVLSRLVLPRVLRNSWGSSQWLFGPGTSTACASGTSPAPARSCRPGRRSAPRRWPFARTCAGKASPTAPECRPSAHRWWSPATKQRWSISLGE